MIDLTAVLWAPDSAKADILNNVGIATSPFTQGMQVTELPGAKWKLTFSYENLSTEYGRKLRAIKAMLRGGAEIAHIIDLSYVPRRLVEPGVPVVAGANQTGSTLATSGWTPNTTILTMGDQISYLSTDGMYRMHIVAGDVASDANGNAGISFFPPMRNPPVDGTAISSVAPKVSVQLTDGGEVTIDGVICSADFTFTEALYQINT